MQLLPNFVTSANGFGFRSDTGEIFQLNPLAVEIIGSLRNREDPDAIARRISDHYGVSVQRTRGDLSAFISQLSLLNLLENYES